MTAAEWVLFAGPRISSREWRMCPCGTRAWRYHDGFRCTGCGNVADLDFVKPLCCCGCGQRIQHSGAYYCRGHRPLLTCEVDSCGLPSVNARAMCSKHYTRWLRAQRPPKPRKPRKPPPVKDPLERFYAAIPERGDGCWEWQGARSAGTGYGSFFVSGSRKVGAHRWSYEHFVGPIPPGLLVRHKCDNRPCVNPDHLEVGTVADNMQDALDRDRACVGERSRGAVLTADGVREIRRRAAAGETLAALASEFGAAVTTIHSVVHRKTWKSVS